MRTVLLILLILIGLANIYPLDIVFCGDVMLGNWMNEVAYREGFDYPFAKIKPIIDSADIAFCNIECPFTTSRDSMVHKKYMYKAKPELISLIKNAGFDVVSLSNNHILDFGYKGMKETIELLKKENISYFGVGNNILEAREPAVLQINNGIVKIIGYSGTFPEEFWADEEKFGTAFQHLDYIREDILKHKKEGNLLFVSFHSGQEGTSELRDYQKELAHAAIDFGADGVIGHHPHVLQAIEIYKNKPIFYSLGNCLFSTYSKIAKESIIAKTIYSNKNELTKIEIYPINVNNLEVEFQPYHIKSDGIIKYLNSLSEEFNTKIDFDSKKNIGIIEIK